MKVRLVILGAGYDTRSVRMLTESLVDEVWELDIETVAASKHVMLQRLRHLRDCTLLTVIPTNLNDLQGFEKTLQEILDGRNDPSCNERDNGDSYSGPWDTIFLPGGVMIYLDEGVPTKMLAICSKLAKEQQQSGSGGAVLLLTDLLRNAAFDDRASGTERDDAKVELQNSGWDLLESSWHVKPSWVRHMGTARLSK
jgi:O-methyltransferase involved in polyketide biosynthesis